ncbi:thiol reductant ABC exporter subunit CydC [Acidihalobacter yilgarnensis]|uniref:Thiol reductant ABC exporter subunit CydC n=1 Tax=Acidihalobacter yilgarnensis TaxID=2819280 RepID=A0A1D8IN78_9GAMM|nr:thiol reductant ABC exporter subunit CydC [Acidihalobacter yilgarnensis]AOU97917.1 thiol reductant ABC exporter subunit CydC [Acidihalobacter yilgarnensis]
MKDLRRLLGLFAPYTRWMLAGIALSLVVMLANIGLLALSGWFITAMAAAGLAHVSMDYFTPAAGIRGLAILRTGGRYLERLVTHEATLRLLAHLRVWFYEHLEPLAPARIQYYRGGDLLSRIRADIDTLDNFYLRVLAPSVAALIGVAILFGFMAVFSFPVALINLAGLILSGIGIPYLAHRAGKRPGGKAVEVRSTLRASVVDGIQGQGELRVYGASGRQIERVGELTHALIDQQHKLSRITGLATAGNGWITQLSIWFALLIAIPLVNQGMLSGPDLAMIALFVMASFETVSGLPLAFQNLGETLAAARRIFEIIDTCPQVEDPAVPAPRPSTADLHCKGVRMRYADDANWALNGFDLTLPAGHRVALIGATGSGKTTLINLLMRFWDYQDGSIMLGGRELREYSGEDLRRFCAVVSQRTHLFNTTIRGNLLLARPDADEVQIMAAAKQARIHDEIMGFPAGYDTFVGEAGIRLSGGQARRVAIARALLKDAPFLILDEPTEGLDADAEAHVLDAIESAMDGRSVLLITHRPHALRHMDEVYVIEHGRVVSHGAPADILHGDNALTAYTRLG